MKKFVGLACLILSTVANASVQVPTNKEFDAVAKQAQAQGFRGFDVELCKSATGKIRVGGLSFWHSPLQIYLVEGNKTVRPTVRKEGQDDKSNKHKFTTVDTGENVLLNLSESNQRVANGNTSVLVREAILMVGEEPNLPELVTCYLRNSGLE